MPRDIANTRTKGYEHNEDNDTKKVNLYDENGNIISKDNPAPMQDIDGAHRNSVNSIFGDKIIGTRLPTIAAQFQYGLRTDDAVIDIVSTGTTVIEDSMLKLRTGIATDGHIGIQGADYLRYIPGHEAYAFFTAVFAPAVVNSIQRIGLFDYDAGEGNGFFIGFNGTQFGITRRRSGVDTFTSVDVATVFPTDSGVFDPTKGNVYKISYGYLGFATIHFEVLLPHGGFIEFASIDYPNSSTETHIANTNIPLRAEMTNVGNTTNLELRVGSVTAGIVDGGGADPIGRWFAFLGATTTLTANTPTEIITFRNKSDFFGITNKISSQLMLMSMATDGNKNVSLRLIKNPTITTPGTFVDADIDSVIEVSTDEAHNLTTGEDMLAWNMARVDSFYEELVDMIIKLRPNEYAVLIALSAGAGDVDYSIRYKDLF